MIRAEKLEDYDLVRETITQPYIYDISSDDDSPPADYLELPLGPVINYVGIYDDDEYLGLYMFITKSAAVVEVHTCLLKAAMNGRTDECARAGMWWVWDNTKAERLVSEVPESNQAALKYSERAGMTVYGRNPRAWLKDGGYQDIILVGITRPEVQ